MVSPSLENSHNVEIYEKELEIKLLELGISDAYHAWYLCTTYGKQSDIIINKSKTFDNQDALERLIRAELWYCIYHEMTNSLTDFFVRRTGRLYFNIPSVKKYMKIISEDCVKYLKWDIKRMTFENENMKLLLEDATTYYEKEFLNNL